MRIDDRDDQDPFISDMLDEIYADSDDTPLPPGDYEPDKDLTPPVDPEVAFDEMPVPAIALPEEVPEEPVQSGAAAAAAARRQDAARKRVERAARRRQGVPDTRTVDSAVAWALARAMREAGVPALVRRAGTVEGLTVEIGPVLRYAMEALRARGVDPVMRRTVIAGKLLPEAAQA
ncbi:hypothetical protein PUR29_25710 [Methylobacterium ajmalii]|uniref:Uncharacterized protein n=2 Tax=Methylobacterium TaxID=407 RepID=A0A0J6S2L0_9HYPH|nr:hypothetical protein [Methylobacterium aquaticum]KMO27748.1 hypothetical protein VP06_29910 [Methylobacterium aquaticum]